MLKLRNYEVGDVQFFIDVLVRFEECIFNYDCPACGRVEGIYSKGKYFELERRAVIAKESTKNA